MKLVNKLFSLEGKTIVVAGGAGQIGFAFCQILADAGANVAIADLDSTMAKNKLDNLDSKVTEAINVYSLDVTDESNVRSVLKEIRDDLGPIYGLINSFHYKGNSRKLDTSSNFFADFENYPLEAWNAVNDVNLRGTFLMCRESITYFKESKGGVIVNISSTYGNVSPNKSIYGSSGINSPVAYAASKSGIINLSRYLATHLSDLNIRVNVLSPGGVFNNQTDEFVEKYNALTPLKRMAKPEDYQGPILFLMSSASSYMTGANLCVDGGWTAW